MLPATHTLNARLLRYRSFPDSEDAYALADDLLSAERYGDARGVAVSALGEEGEDARLLVIEGRAWLMERDLLRAQAVLVRAARIDRQRAETFRWLGEVLLARGDAVRAARALERGLTLDPGDEPARRLRAHALELAARAAESRAAAAAVAAVVVAPAPPPPVIEVAVEEVPIAAVSRPRPPWFPPLPAPDAADEADIEPELHAPSLPPDAPDAPDDESPESDGHAHDSSDPPARHSAPTIDLAPEVDTTPEPAEAIAPARRRVTRGAVALAPSASGTGAAVLATVLLLCSGGYFGWRVRVHEQAQVSVRTRMEVAQKPKAATPPATAVPAPAQVVEQPLEHTDDAAARETEARLALARGRPGDAVALLEPMLSAPTPSAALLALYGHALYRANRVNVAAWAFERALALDAALPEALIGRAEVHLRAERPGDALVLLDRAQQSLARRNLAPEWRARMHTLIGRAYVERRGSGDKDQAVAALESSLTLPEVQPEVYFWLGEALGGRNTPPASDAFKRYLEREPTGRYAARARRALGPLL